MNKIISLLLANETFNNQMQGFGVGLYLQTLYFIKSSIILWCDKAVVEWFRGGTLENIALSV